MGVHGSSESAAVDTGNQPRGGILDSVLTIGSTIGAISNVLSGVLGGTEVADFGSLGSGAHPAIGTVVFWTDKNGETWVLNQSTEETATIFFPNDLAEAEEGEMLILPPASKLPVSAAFREHARVDRLAITPAREGTGAQNPLGGGAKVRASTKQLVNSEVWVKLGSYFEAKVVAPNRTVALVATGSLALLAVSLFRIRDVGSAVAEVVNAWRKPTRGDETVATEAVIPIPAGIDLTSAVQEIEVVVEVLGLEAALEHEHSERRPVPITDADHERLREVEAARTA